MRYYIEALNREVELNDELVNAYKELEGELRQGPFVIVVLSKYGHEPTEQEISNEELSALCNKILATEIKVDLDMPRIIEAIYKHEKEFEKAAQEGELLEFDIEMGD